MNQFNLCDLPSLSFQERQFLPATSGVYFICDRMNRVVYIGQSRNMKMRLKSHNKGQSWHQYTIRFLKCPTEQLLEVEQFMIRRFQPIQNKFIRQSIAPVKLPSVDIQDRYKFGIKSRLQRMKLKSSYQPLSSIQTLKQNILVD